MIPRIVRFALFVVLCSNAVLAQQAADSRTNPSDDKEGLEKQAVAFLRETAADVNTMRTAENRISFSAELAGLMWLHDEKEARAMYSSVFAEFRNLLIGYNKELNELPASDEDGSLATPGFMSFMSEPTDRARVVRKFTMAMAVRQQIVLSLAEHDPDLAVALFEDTLVFVSNAELRKQIESRDTYFQTQLIAQISEKNAGKAAQLASKSLGKGVEYQHIELLKKLHAKDPDKAADFASSILNALKNDTGDKSSMSVISSLIELGDDKLKASKKPDGKRGMFAESELRDLSELLADRIVKYMEKSKDKDPDDLDYDYSSPLSYVSNVEKYAPSRAAQIRQKYKKAKLSTSGPVANAMSAPPILMTGMANSNASGNAAKEAKAKAEEQIMEDIAKLQSKQLPKEEREKFIASSRKIINQMTGRDKKVAALSALATQVSKLGDKELATSIMKEAEALVNPTPKNYQDFLLAWMLASGYAAVEPEKAFPLLEETIWRANDTLNAFVKVGEFIDVAGEMIQDNEVQVGAFGGQMVRGLTKELGMAESTINLLAKADFVKTKNLTMKFERPEVRILAKMMVLRTVLQKKEVPTEEADKKKPVATSVKLNV